MIKILHTADLHLDSPLKSLALRDEDLRERLQLASRHALKRMVDFCIDEDLSAFLIAGDLFDGRERSAKTLAFVIAEFGRLKDAGIPVFYIKGNHDAENGLTASITLPDNVHTFSDRGEKVQVGDLPVWIHGVSFGRNHQPASLLPKFDAPVAQAINIGMLHTSLAGAAGHDPYAPCSVAELRDHGFDYWALGHVHKREVHAQAPWVVMPGMPQGRDIGEDGSKSATLLTIENGQINLQEIPTSSMEFQRVETDISAVQSEDALREHLKHSLQQQAGELTADLAILRLRFVGETTLSWHLRQHQEFWLETAMTLADEVGGLWIDKLELDLSEPSSGEETDDAIDELRQIMEGIQKEESFQKRADETLDQLIKLLPDKGKQSLLPNKDQASALREDLMKQGLTTILARLKAGAK